MSTKATKAKRKNDSPVSNGKQAKTEAAARLEALLIKIENDPHAHWALKEMAALRRERDASGEPYLTIEQIMAELGRG